MTKVAPLGPFNYDDNESLGDLYHCGECGAYGVKLWRDYNTFLDHQSLVCCDCAIAEQNNDKRTFSIAPRTADGKVCVTTSYNPETEPKLFMIYGERGSVGGDQIGWRIPAVPTEDGETYWGYTSVPQRGCDWWNRLPLRKAVK